METIDVTRVTNVR